MTDEQIDHIIGARNRLTSRPDGLIDTRAVDHLDAVLRDVPAGQRNDVDLLLGRRCAVLPDYEALQAACAEVGQGATWYQYGGIADVTPDDMRRIAQDAAQNQEPIEY